MQGTGDTTSEPEATTTRAMVVTVLHRLAGEPAVDYGMNYTDVPDSTWHTEAVRWAASQGIVLGYACMFDPERAITRKPISWLPALLGKETV